MSENKDAFFAALMDQYIHQNELLWSRAQTLYAIQTAAIAGAFAKPAYFTDLIVLSILLTVMLIPIIRRDIQCRECNRPILEKLGKAFDSEFVLNPEAPKCFPLKGDHIIFATIVLLLVVDIGLLTCIPRPT